LTDQVKSNRRAIPRVSAVVGYCGLEIDHQLELRGLLDVVCSIELRIPTIG